MKTIFYLLDSAPYGCEKAYGLINAAIVSLAKAGVTLGLYGDGVYLALAGQDSKTLGVPNLADLLYAYPEIRVLAHEPSIMKRRLLNEMLIETVELVDDANFLESMEKCDFMIIF